MLSSRAVCDALFQMDRFDDAPGFFLQQFRKKFLIDSSIGDMTIMKL